MSEGGEIQDWGDEPPKEVDEISQKEPKKTQTPKWWTQPSYEATQWMMTTLSKDKSTKTETEPVTPEGTSVQTPTTPKTSEAPATANSSLKITK